MHKMNAKLLGVQWSELLPQVSGNQGFGSAGIPTLEYMKESVGELVVVGSE